VVNTQPALSKNVEYKNFSNIVSVKLYLPEGQKKVDELFNGFRVIVIIK
jgi:hypothetical protein